MLPSWIKTDAANHGLHKPLIFAWGSENGNPTLSTLASMFMAMTQTMYSLSSIFPLVFIKLCRVIGSFTAILQHAAVSLDACPIQAECLSLSLRMKTVWKPDSGNLGYGDE